MKTKLLKCWSTVWAVALVMAVGWIIGNRQAILSSDPEQAARQVFLQYNPSSDLSALSLTVVSYSRSVPAGPGLVFEVVEKGTPLANISVQSFLGMGWQAGEFLRIEKTEPEHSREGVSPAHSHIATLPAGRGGVWQGPFRGY